MSQPSRVEKKSDAQEIPTELAELVTAIHALPGDVRDTVEPCLNRVVESTSRRRRILNLVQDAQPAPARHEIPGLRLGSHSTRAR